MDNTVRIPPCCRTGRKQGGILTKYTKILLNFRRLRRAGRKQGGILTVISTDPPVSAPMSGKFPQDSCLENKLPPWKNLVFYTPPPDPHAIFQSKIVFFNPIPKTPPPWISGGKFSAILPRGNFPPCEGENKVCSRQYGVAPRCFVIESSLLCRSDVEAIPLEDWVDNDWFLWLCMLQIWHFSMFIGTFTSLQPVTRSLRLHSVAEIRLDNIVVCFSCQIGHLQKSPPVGACSLRTLT